MECKFEPPEAFRVGKSKLVARVKYIRKDKRPADKSMRFLTVQNADVFFDLSMKQR